MKKSLFLGFFILAVALSGCGNGEKAQGEPSITTGAIVRNVKRGMTKDEVIKAENIKDNFVNNELTAIGELMGKEIHIVYEFLEGKLERVSYHLPNANFEDYSLIRREIGLKYGTGDITEQEYNEKMAELSKQLEELPQSSLSAQEKKKKLEQIKNELKGNREKLHRYDDVVLKQSWLDVDDIIGQEDMRVEMKDVVYSHKREKEATTISILFWANSSYEKIISIDYQSQVFLEKKKQENEAKKADLKNNL